MAQAATTVKRNVAGPLHSSLRFRRPTRTLKWGIVLGAVGLGLILVQFLPYRSGEPIVLGVILVFAAAGLLAYYASVRRLTHPTEKRGAA